MLRFYALFLVLFTFLFADTVDVERIVKEAHKSHKQVYMFIHTTDCGYCESMIEFTFDDKVVKKILAKNFVVIDINVKKEGMVSYKGFTGTNKAFAKQIGYNFYPSSLFFNANADIILSQRGYVEERTFTTILVKSQKKYQLSLH